MKRVLKAFAFAAAIVVALVSCKKEDQPKEVALTGIELNATSQTLQVGQEFQLTVTYKPENATSKPAATWASDAPAVATVDGGKVVAVAAGTAKITATVGTFTAECAITVASAEEEILPVEGNSEWSIIGALLGTNWDKDFVAAKDGDIYVVKNVKLAASDAFKFRKNKDWGENRGAEGDVEPYKLAAGTAITVIHNGKNLAAPGDGIYDIYYNAAVEQLCLVAKDGTPKWNEPEVKGLIDIDGDFSDWAEIESVGKGTHAAFKVAVDDNYLYVYTKRIKGEGEAASGYEEMWGHASEGYIYLALDLDKNPETGDMLWTNGPFEFVGYHYPFGGSAESPAINEKPGASTSCAPSSASTKNIFCKGVIGTDEVEIEYSIPRADLPAIPETPFIVYSWGSLGLDKVEYHVGEPQPAPEYVHDYTPSAEYLAETNLWKAVDANHTLDWSYNPNWAGALDAPETTFKESTYEFYLAEECTAGQWTTQMRIVPTEDLLVSSGKKYNFYCNVVSTTGAKIWIKMHKFGENWPIAFETADSDGGASRIVLPAGEIVPIKVEGFEPMYETPTPVCLLFDVTPHAANNTIYIKDIIVEEIVPETGSSVSEIIAAADETAIELKESLVVAKCVRGVVVTDGAKYIYAYGQTPLADVKVGDKVTMKGTKKTYNGVPEIDSPTDVVVKSSGNAVPAIEAKDITATVESYAATEAEYISLTGTLAKSGNYYNLNLEGTTAKVGSISYPLPELNADSFDGKKITVTGFFNGLSGGGKYVNIVTTKIEEVVAFTGITIDGDMSDWAGVEGAVGTGGVNAAFKVSSDETNLYFYVKRTTERMSEVWAGNAYHYYAFDIDGDASNDVDLWGNKADILLVVYPYAGTADAPKIEIAKAGATMPEANSVANAVAKGVVTDSGVETEVSIPRADIVGLPATEFKVSYWSNKGGSEKLTVSLTL